MDCSLSNMADSNHDILSKCGICLSYYTEPRLLDCFHKFCTPCLNKLADGNVTFSYPDKTQEDLKLCQICDEERFATVKCLNCDDYLCKQCHEYHTKVKIKKERSYEIVVNQSRVRDSIIRDSEEIECNIHGKELLLFCKPCISVICEDCRTNTHKHHEVQTILRAAKDDRDLFIAATACLKARIPILENTIELANMGQHKHYKCSLLVKREIRSHAAGLKDIFCKTVDLAMNENLEKVDQMQKTEIKQLYAYKDQVTTDKLSLISRLRTSDDIVHNCSDKDILRMSANLKRMFSHSINDDGKSINLCNIKYETPTLSAKQIQTFVENVNTRKTVKCLNFEHYLCKQCHEYHTKVKTLKEHTYAFFVNQPHASRVHDSEKRDSEKIECNIHGKELLLICKPCNSVICEDCRTHVHKHHEVKTILRAASDERDLFIAATACLKARIPILENTIELANIERDKHYKCSLQVKQDIKSHAAGLKDIFCKTVDLAMNENIEQVDQIEKTEIKQLDTYIDEITTDKLSLVSRLKTSDYIVQNCSDIKNVSEFEKNV